MKTAADPTQQTDDVDDGTPGCNECGEHVGINESGALILHGMWMLSPEHGLPVFVLDPDHELMLLQLPNGQLAIVTDTPNPPATSGATHHYHEDCLFDRLGGDNTLDDKDDDDSDSLWDRR